MILFGINAIVCLGVSMTNSYANIFSLGFGGIVLIAMIIIVMIYRPQGLLGRYEITWEIFRHGIPAVFRKEKNQT